MAWPMTPASPGFTGQEAKGASNMSVPFKSSLPFVLGYALFCPPTAGASSTPEPKAEPKAEQKVTEAKGDTDARRNAAAVLGLMLRDNASFVHSHAKGYFEPFQNGQHPRALVVGCADSRFHLQSINATPDGDVFEIRNIGNQV